MLASKTVWESPWFSVEEVIHESDHSLDCEPYYRIRHPDSVIILPITQDGKFVFVRQYRPTVERFTLELPAGGIDEGEDPVRAASRELVEEVGMIADEMILLGTGGLVASRFFNNHNWFVALGVKRDPTVVSELGLETVLLAPSDVRVAKGFQTDHLMALGMISLARSLLGARVPQVW